MTFDQWWDDAKDVVNDDRSLYASLWNGAMEEAAKLMEARNVSASAFYGSQIRALKS